MQNCQLSHYAENPATQGIVIQINNHAITIVLRPPSWLKPRDITLLKYLMQNRCMTSIANAEKINIKTLYSRKKTCIRNWGQTTT